MLRGSARMAISWKRRLQRRFQGFTTTCNPSARVGTVSRLIFGGFGFVKVPEAYVSVKESFSCEKKPPTRSDLLID
jgi:hypothetical protein